VRFVEVDGWAEPVCDQCGCLANHEDVRLAPGEERREFRVDMRGDVWSLVCLCRFCRDGLKVARFD